MKNKVLSLALTEMLQQKRRFPDKTSFKYYSKVHLLPTLKRAVLFYFRQPTAISSVLFAYFQTLALQCLSEDG